MNLKEESCSRSWTPGSQEHPHRNPRGYLEEGGQPEVDPGQAGKGGPVNTSLRARSSDADALAVAPVPLPTCQV